MNTDPSYPRLVSLSGAELEAEWAKNRVSGSGAVSGGYRNMYERWAGSRSTHLLWSRSRNVQGPGLPPTTEAISDHFIFFKIFSFCTQFRPHRSKLAGVYYSLLFRACCSRCIPAI